jgi:hypothetical protein
MGTSGICVFAVAWAIFVNRFVPPDDPPSPETLPTPRQVITESSPHLVIDELPLLLPYERVNRYEVWQYVAPDRQGRFRPRVIYSPFGAYYLYNGEPYLFAATRSLDFMPYASD